MKKQNNKKGMGAVIALAVVILVSVIIITVAIAGMIKENGGLGKKEDTSKYSMAGVTNTTPKDKNNYFDLEDTQDSEDASHETGESIVGGFANIEAGDNLTQSTTKKNELENPIKEYEKLSKNGDNILSDHHNNKYIKLVSEKFNVDKELLVAIYGEPDQGNNFVLEFSDKRDSDGNVINSPETLTKVYAIDKDKNIAVATGKTTGNIGVSYAEGTLCFNMIKTIVMPQYPEYFTGVEK